MSSDVEPLVDIARFVDQVENDAVLHAFAEFVGVDVTAEDFQAGLFVLLQERRAGETDEDRVGHDGFHDAVQFAALGAVTFVHEDEDFADGLAGLVFKILDVGFEVVHILAPELVDQGTQQARRGLPKLLHQVAAAAGAFDRFACIVEDALDLFVQFVAVGDDGDARVGIVFQDPLGQQNHDDALAAALRVPDDAALSLTDMLLRGFDAKILMSARQFLDAVEQNEVVHQFEQAILLAELEQVFVQFEAGVVFFVFLPLEEVFFLGADGSVLQSFAVVAGKDELHGAEEPLVEFRLLIGQVLTNAVADD